MTRPGLGGAAARNLSGATNATSLAMQSSRTYPRYSYFPRSKTAPTWTSQVIGVFRAFENSISAARAGHKKSDAVLSILRPELLRLGFEVEAGKAASQKVPRPVLYGDDGELLKEYDIDAYHSEWHVALEIEAGRAIKGGALYRDLIQTSLLVDTDFAVIAVPQRYSGEPAYEAARSVLDAIYASLRLTLPFKGVLLIGY